MRPSDDAQDADAAHYDELRRSSPRFALCRLFGPAPRHDDFFCSWRLILAKRCAKSKCMNTDNSIIVGKCGICGGVVSVPRAWWAKRKALIDALSVLKRFEDQDPDEQYYPARCGQGKHWWHEDADTEGDTCNCGKWYRFADRIEEA